MLLLEQTLKEAKSDAAKQEKRAAIAELRAAELAEELTKLRRELQLRAQHEAEKAAQEQAASLRSYDRTQIVVAAQRHAFAARRDFYFHTRWPGEAKPRWELEDRLLDVDSEKKVLGEAESKNRELTYRLESARRNAGEFP
jgi:hypothetical protein